MYLEEILTFQLRSPLPESFFAYKNVIFDAYDEEVLKSKNILKAELYCVCPPEKAQTDKIKETLKKKYGVSDVLLEVNTDEALMGGYRLEVNGVEYDKSVQGMIKALQNRISGR